MDIRVGVRTHTHTHTHTNGRKKALVLYIFRYKILILAETIELLVQSLKLGMDISVSTEMCDRLPVALRQLPYSLRALIKSISGVETSIFPYCTSISLHLDAICGISLYTTQTAMNLRPSILPSRSMG